MKPGKGGVEFRALGRGPSTFVAGDKYCTGERSSSSYETQERAKENCPKWNVLCLGKGN